MVSRNYKISIKIRSGKTELPSEGRRGVHFSDSRFFCFVLLRGRELLFGRLPSA